MGWLDLILKNPIQTHMDKPAPVHTRTESRPEPRWLQPLKFGVALFILAASGWLAYTVIHNLPSAKTNAKLASEAPPVVTVTTSPVTRSNVEEKMSVTGTIRCWDELKVGPEVGGLHVKAIYVEEGEYVKKGQLLAELNANLLLAELAQAEAKLKSAQANLAKASQPNRLEEIAGLKAAYEQARNNSLQEQSQLAKARVNLDSAESLVEPYEFLAQRGAVSKVEAGIKKYARDTAKCDLQSAQDKLKSAENSVEMAKQKWLQAVNGGRAEDVLVSQAACEEMKAQIQRYREQINQTKIKAPDDGKILQRNVHIGDTSDFSKPFFVMSRMNRLELVAFVNNEDLARLREGQTAIITGGNGANLPTGRVRLVGPQLSETSRLAPVKIELPCSDKLLPGMFVRAEILLAKHDGLTVPLSCLETRGDESFVFVLKDKRAIHVRIRPGAQQDGKVEIKSGLSEGQLVINKGAHFLSDRDPVDTTENR